MPNYPIFYTIQNDKDSSTNVFSLNFSEDKGELKLKHIIQEFPLDLVNESYHIRFKIQCNEAEPKIFAWIDPSNLEARAPIINNSVYVKILWLTREGDSKLFNKQKILNAKQSTTKAIPKKEEKQARDSPIAAQSQEKKIKLQPQPQHANIHHSSSDPDLVHKKHINSSNLLDDDHKDSAPKSQFKQKSSNNIDSQPQQNVNFFDDDEDDKNVTTPVSQQLPKANQDAPKSGVMNILDSDDEHQPNIPNKNNGNNNQNANNMSNQGTNDDLWGDDNAPKFGQYENHIEGHSKAPLSEFEIELKKCENEYIINGEMDGAKLKIVKARIQASLEQKRVDEDRKQKEQIEQDHVAKMDAKYKLEYRVKNWKEANGTRKDIRTLLSTLQNVLWSDAQWTPVSFFDLSTEENLKTTIKKVLVKFHPDRNRNNIENKYICEQIIDEIKQAQKEYESKQPR